MAIHYRVIEKKNTLPNAKRTTCAYAAPKQVGKVSIKELAEDIADRTTLHRADVRAVLDVLSISTMNFLKKGLGVELGEMGNLSIRLKSKSTEKKEDFLPKNVLKTKIQYTPSVEMRSKLARIGVRDMNDLLSEGSTTGSTPGTPEPKEPSKEPTSGSSSETGGI